MWGTCGHQNLSFRVQSSWHSFVLLGEVRGPKSGHVSWCETLDEIPDPVETIPDVSRRKSHVCSGALLDRVLHMSGEGMAPSFLLLCKEVLKILHHSSPFWIQHDLYSLIKIYSACVYTNEHTPEQKYVSAL